MMHIAYSPISAKFITLLPIFVVFDFLASPTLTMMHLRIMLNTNRTPLSVYRRQPAPVYAVRNRLQTESGQFASTIKHRNHMELQQYVHNTQPMTAISSTTNDTK